jgi:glycosyltransferase 2 family protein
MTLGRIIRSSVGFVFAVIFLWLVVRHISFEELTQAFDNAKPGWIIAATVAFFVGYAFRIERWRLMLAQDNSRLAWRNCAGPLFASVAANNVLPFRAGDIIRALGFNKRLGITASVSVTTLLMERALDLMMVLGLLGFTLWMFDLNTHSVIGVGGLMLGLITLIVLAILMYPSVLRSFINGVEGFIGRFFSQHQKGIAKQMRAAEALLEHLSKKKLMAQLIGWSALAWIAEGLVFLFAALALPSVSQPVAAWLALTVGTLSTVIPSTPGFIGTFDYFTAQSMALMGNDLVASAAYAFTVHALLWFPPTIVGGIYLLLNPVSFTKTLELSKHG